MGTVAVATSMAPVLSALLLCLASALAAPGVPTTAKPGEDACLLSLDAGRCDAIKHRFAFDAAKNDCVSFVYGGCGGNRNNFVSLADCQAACPKRGRPSSLRSLPAPATPELQSDEPKSSKICAACPNEVYLTHYQELGCQPIFSGGDNQCCASRYDCGNRALQSDDKCYHEGKAYEVQSEIPADATPNCLVHCKCTQTSFDKAPRMNCVSIECPELFNGPLTDDNCVRQYQRDKCCSQSTYCAPTGMTLETATNVAHCSYDGRNYVEGQKFYPDKEPSLACICQPGFNGTLSEPHCHRIKCNLELHYGHYLKRQCVPIYYKNRICPIDWSCPDDFTMVTPSAETTPTSPTKKSTTEGSKGKDNHQCEFGPLKFARGTELPQEIAGDCVSCKCLVPPVPTCVKDYATCKKN